MFDLQRLKNMLDFRQNILQKGYDHYRNGAIREVKVNRVFQNTCIEVDATIKAQGVYSKATIEFDEYNRYESHNCTCIRHKDRWDICEHVAALYFHLTESQDARQSYGKLAANDFIDRYLSSSFDKTRRKVRVEYIIQRDEKGDYIFGTLSLKVGVDRLYVVKNIRQFLEDTAASKTIEFGKTFEFNPAIHEFSEVDSKILQYLREVYEIEKTYKYVDYYYTQKQSIFSGKNLRMSDAILINILKLLGDKEFTLVINEEAIENVRAEFDEMPFDIEVKNRETGLAAEIKYKGKCHFFSRKDDIIYLDGKLYILDRNTKAYSLYKSARKNRVDKLEFTGESRNIFLSILPKISEDKRVKVSENITKHYVREEFEARIYLDRFKKGIKVGVEYKYGDEIFNPMVKNKISPFLIRDVAREDRILNLLDESGFKVSEEGVYLDNPDRIYNFFRDVIPILSNEAELFYTDDVRNMYIGRFRGYRTSLKTRNTKGVIDISIEMDGVDEREVKDILKAIREKKKYHRLKNGGFISLEDENIKELENLASSIENDEIKNNVISLSKYRAVSVFQRLREETKNSIENSLEVDKLLDKILNPNLQEISVPSELNGILRDYQITGFKWMKTLSNVGFFGILADDMGLGKTLQAIALLYDEKNEEPSIVVAPSSLIYNWEGEIKRFAPGLRTLVVSGSKEQREELIKVAENYDVIITSYPLIRRDIELYGGMTFNYCIIDEAQHIKNPDSINASSVKRIYAKKRFALTGTPMENSLTELWSIFDFLMPGFLLSKSRFTERFELPIARDEDSYALEELRKIITPFILRRRKKDVLLELPDKIETKLVCELSEEQRGIYNAYLARTRDEIENIIDEDGFESSRIQILAALTRLRQICCHPSVFIENYQGGSGKLDLLEELLEELLAGNHRILLFSQFTSLLGIIRELLDRKNIKYMYLDGSTPVVDRLSLVDRFNGGEGEIFLISLKAGGTGLNLTSADTVIHFDPWWNPAVEEQASDRAHRIGQKKVVQVFKIITKDTVEEKIFELQNMKKELINSVIKEGETFITKLTEDELLDILSI